LHQRERRCSGKLHPAPAFWGGNVNTQRVLPFGNPDEARTQVRDRLQVFGTGDGFIFNPSRKVQAGVPVVNLLALYQAVVFPVTRTNPYTNGSIIRKIM